MGVQGVGRHAVVSRIKDWNRWLESFIESGVGERYWGPGTESAWSFPADREKQVFPLPLHLPTPARLLIGVASRIRDFMRAAIMSFSRIIRKECKSTGILLLSSEKCPIAVDPSPEASPEAAEKPAILAERKRGLQALLAGLSSCSGSATTTTPTTATTTAPTTTPTTDSQRSRKRKKRGSPTVIDIGSGSESSSTLSSNPSTVSSSVFLASGPRHPPRDLVFETTVTGSSEIRLIYCASTHPLAGLVGEVRRKCALRSVQEVKGIRVKTGEKVFSVDMQETRDWRYILGVVAENGGRAEMFVSVL